MVTHDSVQTALDQARSVLRTANYLTPLNLATERAKFFTSQTSNPQLEYPEVPTTEIKATLAQLKAVEFQPQNFEETLTFNKLQEMVLSAELLLTLNTENLTQTSQKLFQGELSVKYQQLAEIDAAYQDTFRPLETLTGEETVVKVKEYLAREYQVTDWSVETSGQGDFYVRVKGAQKQILVNAAINWDFTDLDTMLAHEIDGHVLRYLNAKQRPEPHLRSPLPFYIKTEEGLAAFLGDYCAANEAHGKLTLKHHALKYLAGLLARTASFREVYTFLRDHGFTESLAFQRTFRLKRGLSDTSIPGCFVKEAIYYEGIIDVKEYFGNGGSAEKLFAAKIGLNDIDEVDALPTTLVPKRLKIYLKKSS